MSKIMTYDNKLKIIDYLVDTAIINFVTMLVVMPYSFFMGMSARGLWIQFSGFWTVGWLASFVVAVVIKKIRGKYPYLNTKAEE